MALDVNIVPFTLVETTRGASPVFGALNSGADMTNWHWRADLSGLRRYGWTVMFTSIILSATGPADYQGFVSAPNPSYMPRAYALDGGDPLKWIVPLTTSIAVDPVYDIDGPWRLSTDDNLTEGFATYFLTEALKGGDEDGDNFQWRDPLWKVNVSLPGKAAFSFNPAGLAYFTRAIESVDYWFSADSWWSPETDRTHIFDTNWAIVDARLIVLGCTVIQPGQLLGGPGAAGQIRVGSVHGGVGGAPGLAPPAQGSYSIAGLVGLALGVGITGDSAAVAGAVAMAESGGNPSAVNYDPGPPESEDRGLWQINNVFHPEVSDACAFDPKCNAQGMKAISGGGTDWTPWATYNSGAYLTYLAVARAALAALQGGGSARAASGAHGQIRVR